MDIANPYNSWETDNYHDVKWILFRSQLFIHAMYNHHIYKITISLTKRRLIKLFYYALTRSIMVV